MSSIILFRHGDVDTKENIFCGWLNISLSKKGISQAKVLSKKLKNEKIDFAFCSDQLRSKQCLIEVLKYHKKAKVIVDHRLRERHYGLLTGYNKLEAKVVLEDKYHKIHRGYSEEVPFGENFNDVGKRVFSFLNDLLRFLQDNDCTVVISAHTTSLRLIQEYLEALPRDKVEKLEHHPADFKRYCLEFDKS